MEMYVAFLVGSPLMSEAQIWDELALHVRNNETQLHLGRRMPKISCTVQDLKAVQEFTPDPLS